MSFRFSYADIQTVIPNASFEIPKMFSMPARSASARARRGGFAILCQRAARALDLPCCAIAASKGAPARARGPGPRRRPAGGGGGARLPPAGGAGPPPGRAGAKRPGRGRPPGGRARRRRASPAGARRAGALCLAALLLPFPPT